MAKANTPEHEPKYEFVLDAAFIVPFLERSFDHIKADAAAAG